MEPNIDQKTLQTIEKLFRLSESSNENEANVAMKKAMSLLAQHNLSQSQFNNLKKVEDEIGISFVQEGKNFITWRSILFNSICKSHFCKVITFSSTGKYGVIGKSVNRDAVVMSYRYLCHVIERESLNALLKYKTNEHGKKFCNSFKIGMSQRISSRLLESQKIIQSESNALVKVYDSCENENLNFLNNRFGSLRTSNLKVNLNSDNGYYRGLVAGESVSLTPVKEIN